MGRCRVIGDRERLPEEVQEKLRETELHTEKNAAMTMVVALSYSARWEITQAMKEIVTEHQQENAVPLRPEMITEELLDRHMQTNFMPDPDLLIRTGGEERISNYLLWQAAYAELFFSSVYWPDFGREALREALEAYTARERRFGKTSEQIQLED